MRSDWSGVDGSSRKSVTKNVEDERKTRPRYYAFRHRLATLAAIRPIRGASFRDQERAARADLSADLAECLEQLRVDLKGDLAAILAIATNKKPARGAGRTRANKAGCGG